MYNVRSRPGHGYAYQDGRNDVHGMRCRKIHVLFDSSVCHLCRRLCDRHAFDSSDDVYGMYLW